MGGEGSDPGDKPDKSEKETFVGDTAAGAKSLGTGDLNEKHEGGAKANKILNDAEKEFHPPPTPSPSPTGKK
ncbi:hypothetical protein [Burkholderia anthina]|uniref:hypothetical protein n=1 Tax=Burkholderia anthina TaxID=179879 RepID=UPI000A5B8473|nr:hypothetical protein [Burkholderia anthina]